MEWYNHPTALLLSEKARTLGWFDVYVSISKPSSMVTIDARNSRKLMEARCCRCGVSSYRHAVPCVVNPPRPHSHASEYTMSDGVVMVILFMLTPLSVINVMMNFHSCRSCTSFVVNVMCDSVFFLLLTWRR